MGFLLEKFFFFLIIKIKLDLALITAWEKQIKDDRWSWNGMFLNYVKFFDAHS